MIKSVQIPAIKRNPWPASRNAFPWPHSCYQRISFWLCRHRCSNINH